MAKFSNFIYVLLYIIHIIISVPFQESTNCGENQIFSSFSMNCVDRNVLVPNQLKCGNNTITRDDGYCIDNSPNYGNNSIQVNYFGYFLDKIMRSEKTAINQIPLDSHLDNAINNNCQNEYTLLCQQLLNLCAWELYDRNKQNVDEKTYCRKVYGKESLKKGMFYNDTYIGNTETLSKIDYSLKSETYEIANHNLNFWVAKYYFNGTLLMFQRLEFDFLQCSNANEEKVDYKFFGNNIESKCFIDITKYLDYRNTFFYEIFLERNYQNQPKILIEIPIQIINGNTNKDNRLNVKRMFLHYYNKSVNTYYYAKKVKLCVETIKGTKEEQIHLPKFEVTYAEVKRDNFGTNSDLEYTFISEYKSDISEFLKNMKIVFIVFAVVFGLLIIYRIYIWCRLNPRDLIQSNYIVLFLLEVVFKICKYTGLFCFFFHVVVIFYWFFAYKLQFRVYYFMPPLDDTCYDTYRIIFITGFCCYFIYMIIRIYKQISFDIFFIDWEAEKNMAMNDIKSTLDNNTKYKKYRSAWRMIHVVNQFNELQKKRTFHIYFAFSWIVLLYFRCYWYRKELQVPRDALVYKAPVNFVLRNFIAGIIFTLSSLVEIILVRLLQIWLPLKKQEFMDLCSVSNISVFILDGLLHGYYIHGLSPIGKADVNYDELFLFLKNEGSGAMRSRGLENDNNEDHCKNQSYEMFISHAMRTIYDGLYIIQTESMLAKGVNARKYLKKSRLGLKLFKNFLNFEKDQTMLDNYMNNQLKSKIDIATSNVIQYIKDKSFLQRILGYTIDDNELMKMNAPDILFYRDYGQKFDDVLFSGMEIEWFIMDLFIFQFFMTIGLDEFISMFLTFLVDYLLYYIRSYFGNKNVAKKAAIDDRFLN